MNKMNWTIPILNIIDLAQTENNNPGSGADGPLANNNHS